MEKLISEISSGITSAKELKKQIQKIDITKTWREEKYFAKFDTEHENFLCTNCEGLCKVCHNNCDCKVEEFKDGCREINRQGYCNSCNCHLSAHKKVKYMYIEKTRKVEVTKESLIREKNAKQESLETQILELAMKIP